MVAPIHWTADMVRALPDDGLRYETIFGELLVSPAPRELHQRVQLRLTLAVGNYLGREQVGVVYPPPIDLSWDDPDVLVQPDMTVVDPDEAATGVWARMKTVLLAVEVLSPGSRRADRVLKRRLYEEKQVAEYWIVDADAAAIEVVRAGSAASAIVTDVLSWAPAGAREPLVINLPTLFAPLRRRKDGPAPG